MRLWSILITLFVIFLPTGSLARPTMAYQQRASQLFDLLSAPGDEEAYFSTLFLDAVPVTQWRALAADLRKQHGKPIARGAVQVESPTTGMVEIRYERATVGFTLVVAPQAPYRVIGLQLVGTRQSSDNMDRILSDIAALPGHAALAIARLDETGPVWLHGHRAEALMATGSSFKLYILAELARTVAAGERRWSDVIPLSHKSFSGRLLTAPDGAPMTLHSLALAMIAESDNSAADTLLLALGRTKVDAMVGISGHARPAATLPVLTTAEAFALKMPANADLAQRYAAATMDARRALIAAEAKALTAGAVDIGTVADVPTAIDSIEWFATPRDMVHLIDWLRRNGGDALPIMAVNPGIAPADAKRWRYLGYKGGSEPGVIAMNFLAQARDGRWFAMAASWNDSAARVDEARFVALMTRALNLLAQ